MWSELSCEIGRHEKIQPFHQVKTATSHTEDFLYNVRYDNSRYITLKRLALNIL